MQFIKEFKDLSSKDVEIAGGKGASLGEMTQAGIPVPNGFVVLSESFEKFINKTNLSVEIDATLDKVDTEQVHTIENASEQIQSLILNSEIPIEIEKEISSEFKKLGSEFVAVRSSATSEDSADAAWAGQLDSFLNTTKETLIENVRKCWASLFTPRAIFYRFEKKLHKEKVSVAVVIQKMINSEESGIAFSVHPVTQDRNQMIIEAGFGLGEAIVSGQITPDAYVTDKQDLHIIDISVNEQRKGLYRLPKGGNEWKELEEKGKEQVLNEKEITELSKLIIKIENHYDFPVDIEWAKEKGKFHIVQSRPITTLIKEEKKVSKENVRNSSDWIYYLTRPFNLFETSLWHQWYENPQTIEIFGEYLESGLYIESPRGSIRQYRKGKEFEVFMKAVEDLVLNNPERCIKFLKEGLEINKRAEKNLEENTFEDLEEATSFLTRLALLSALIPYLAPDILKKHDKKNKEIEELSTRLRKVSYYPKFIKDIIIPIATSRLKELGVEDEGAISAITLNELLKKDIENIESRLKNVEEDKCFVYRRKSRKEEIEFFNDNSQEVINIEKTSLKNVKELIGTPAYNGKVIGRVRLVLTKNIKHMQFKKGDILVASSTNPDILPVMKKASAIITDEGGITCHAAIISRELKIPCVTGTKFATQVLRDGDLIEVDANSGTARIIESEMNDKAFHLDSPRNYQRLFQGSGMPFIISNIFMDYYKKLDGLAVFADNNWTTFLPHESIKKTLKDGLKLYSDRKDFIKYRDDFEDYKKSGVALFNKISKKKNITKRDMQNILDLTTKNFYYYSKTEFFYLDEAYDHSKKDKTTEDNLKEFDKIKNNGREYLNGIFFGDDSFLFKFLGRLSKQVIIPREDLLMYNKKELLEVFDDKKVDAEELSKRRKSYIMQTKDKKLLMLSGDDAENLTNKFLHNPEVEGSVLKGTIANKGKLTGKIKVIPFGYDKFHLYKKMISEMDKGDILVAETTSPELMAACKKAGAILTNQGGLMSHAAIVSREFNIPCIVGLGNITDLVKDGDEVEVDADSGVVRILEGEKIKWVKLVTRESYFLQFLLVLRGVRNGMDKIVAFFDKDLKWPAKDSFSIGRKKTIRHHGSTRDLKKNKKILALAMNSDKFLPLVFKNCEELSNEMINVARKLNKTNFDKKSNLELNELFNEYRNIFLKLAPYLSLTTRIGMDFSTKLSDAIRRDFGLDNNSKKLAEIVSVVSMPDKPTFAEQLNREVLEKAKDVVDKKDVVDFAKKLKESYEWIPVDYSNDSWGMNHFTKLLSNAIKMSKEELKEKIKTKKNRCEEMLYDKEKLMNDDKMSKESKGIAKGLSTASYLNDLRKGAYCQLNLYSKKLFLEIAKRSKLSYEEIMNSMPEEINSFLEKNVPFDKKELKDRGNNFIVLRKGGINSDIFSGKEAVRVEEQELEPEIELKINEVVGQSASAGIVRGEVVILSNIKDIKKVREGNVLVSTMTTVNYLPAMKKAVAFVTDEGGLTSHAAIVARELNKPCIIGTKNATQVLKDGDFVEVDANEGIVRIIKK